MALCEALELAVTSVPHLVQVIVVLDISRL